MNNVHILNASGKPIHSPVVGQGLQGELAVRENVAALMVEFDKLALQPGETLVLRPSAVVSTEEAHRLLEHARKALPPHAGVMLVQHGTGIGVFDADTTAKIIARATPPSGH